jgi:hypothetical protein
MSYSSEHRRLAPVLELAKQLDVSKSADPRACFDPGNGGFMIWALPHDKPTGWDNVIMDTGAFEQPCEYVASVTWGWESPPGAQKNIGLEEITHLVLSTDAYALAEMHKSVPSNFYHNRPEDLAWARAKIAWLFQQAQVALPEIRTE